jgi:hypothetical protein
MYYVYTMRQDRFMKVRGTDGKYVGSEKLDEALDKAQEFVLRGTMAKVFYQSPKRKRGKR